MARSIPNASWRIRRIGVTPCTVDEAFETIRCSGESSRSLTPITIVMSGFSDGGASRMMRRAPAARCRSASLAGAADVARLEDDVDAQGLPVGHRWLVLAGENRDLSAYDIEAAVDDPRLVGESSEDRVELEQVLDSRRRGEVADRADADVLPVVEDPEEIATDAPEAVETDRRDHERRRLPDSSSWRIIPLS